MSHDLTRVAAAAALALALALLGAGCAAPPASDVPAGLSPAPGQVPALTLAARGAQIYECRSADGADGAASWAFVAPLATLHDASGALVGQHGAGPHWTAADGSRIVGRGISARADAPRADAIPWLLITTETTGAPGVFGGVASVQRIHTEGGVAPPASECTRASVGRAVHVPYTADYRFFTPFTR